MKNVQLNNRELRAERSEVLREARTLSNKGKLSQVDQRKFDDLMREAETLKEQYESMEARMMAPIRGGALEPREESTRERDHKEAFRSYLRYGRSEMPVEHREFLESNFRGAIESRDMGTGGQGAYPGATTGFLVPVSFSDAIESALRFSGNLMRYCTILPTETGAPLPYPLQDDTQTQAEIIGENQQVTSQDVNLSQLVFGSYKFSSKMVKASLELVQDSAFPLEDWLAGVLGVRFARALNQFFTTGTGTNQPKGLITSAAAAGNIVNAIGSSGNTGAADGTNTIGTTDLQNLIHACDPLYRDDPSTAFMMHDQTQKSLRSTLDKYGRPLLQQSLTADMPNTLLGYPVALNNSMDQLQAGPSSPPVSRYTISYGPLKKYLVRRVKDMTLLVLRERFADYGQLAYLSFMRVDGNLLNAAQEAAQCPIALLKNTA